MSGSSSEASRTLHVRVEGQVQGVGFRRFVERAATALGLAGWVRNLTDGSVEVLAVGSEASIAMLRERLAAGPRHATISRLLEQPGRAALPDGSHFRLLPDADPGAPVPLGDALR